MAQINVILNKEEILQLLADDRNEAMKELLRKSFNQILPAESSAQLGAENYERTEERLQPTYESGRRSIPDISGGLPELFSELEAARIQENISKS